MQPALNPALGEARDRVLTDKLSKHLYSYTRGDVVTLWSPSHPQRLLIKRLIALEGDWLTVPGSSQIVKIPQVGCPLRQPLPRALLLMTAALQGCCWVEGDNHSESSDSSSSFGPVRALCVLGMLLSRRQLTQSHAGATGAGGRSSLCSLLAA